MESNQDKSIADIRQEYGSRELLEENVLKNPLDQFKLWLNEAISSKLPEPTALVLSTISGGGKPAARVVLLKGFSDKGFTFFTNYNSQKGQELLSNPFASMTFFWPELERQIRIEGKVQKVNRKESEDYFRSRPRASQIGAWASNQSKRVSKDELIKSFAEQERRWENQEVECPAFWGGFILIPEMLEFWQGRPGRFHDRITFELGGDSNWSINRLAP